MPEAYVTDTSFDPRAEPTTTRAAWNKVRGNLERGTHWHSHILDLNLTLPIVAESKARQAFVNTLDVDILKPLTSLKVGQGLLIRITVSVLIGLFNRNRWHRRESGFRKS
jgi:hypothetical protein